MATLSLVIFAKQIKRSGECNIYVQISHNRETAWMKTDIFVDPANWKERKVVGGRFGDRHASIKNLRLSENKLKYEKLLIENTEATRFMNAGQVKLFLSQEPKKAITDFYEYTNLRAERLKKLGKTASYTILNNVCNRVKEFSPRTKLSFSAITKDWLEEFESYYLQKGSAINNVAIYMRYIRLMFNDAIREYNVDASKLVILNYPFKQYEIRTEKTLNRDLPIESIRKIRDFVPLTKRETIARDIFILQLYLLGINPIDLFYLTSKNLVGNRIQFSRRKTNRFNNILIHPEAQAIIDKYRGEKYLLWFADHCKETRTEPRKAHSRDISFQYKDQTEFIKLINVQLKVISKRLELQLAAPLTSYWVRHSFATLMRSIGISKDTISLCLGHTEPEQNLKTSGIYIDEDFEDCDVANRELIDYISSEYKDGKSWKKREKTKKKKMSTTDKVNEV